MKFLILSILFVMIGCNNKTESAAEHKNTVKYHHSDHCSCLRDMKTNKSVLAFQPDWMKEQDGNYLSFQCASVMIMSINDENGNKYEKEKVDCLSKRRLRLKINSDFRLTEDEHSAQDSFDERLGNLKLLLHKPENQFFTFDLNDQNEITSIGLYYVSEGK